MACSRVELRSSKRSTPCTSSSCPAAPRSTPWRPAPSSPCRARTCWRTPRTCTSPAPGGPTACSNGRRCCADSTPRRKRPAIRPTSTDRIRSSESKIARNTMPNARVIGLRSVELGVPDLEKSAEFYRNVWGLEDVVSTADTIHMRGTGTEHHVLTLRQRPKAAFLGVHFAAANHAAVNQLHAQAQAYGASVDSSPAALSRSEGGGYGFAMRSPEGQPIFISSDVDRFTEGRQDRSRPTKL